ncbi:2-iminobutanoate/2-iminopropanoate deaminase isoform X1 [Amblyraja radiata]|uniref:2-iminobutanoate/2-iminopropanoate deaminase isoform X1 n=1 Tax=Amblyraja radiata TaxID=386614 RepID=UPI0014041E71|nr:2-iminobutanoate/2-iminopropanoate deaminase isoform X1 [Amblyraja radiata]
MDYSSRRAPRHDSGKLAHAHCPSLRTLPCPQLWTKIGHESNIFGCGPFPGDNVSAHQADHQHRQSTRSYRPLQALINMGEILKAANCDYNHVIKTTVLLADINDFNCVNEVYKQYFKSNFPARAAYQVAALPRGGRVEIEAVAILGPIVNATLEQKL